MLPDKIHFGAIMERHRAEVHTAPFPKVGDDDIVVKVTAVNICTADYQQWMGLRDFQGFPMAAGHELAGVIVEKGARVTDSFEIGQQVTRMGRLCGMCKNCRSGNTSGCTEGLSLYAMRDDGFYGAKNFADYIVCNPRTVMQISNDIPPAVAALGEPTAAAVFAMKKGRVAPGENVVIIGAGPMGLINAQMAHAFGARVIISELDAARAKKARAMGIADVIDAAATDPVAEVFRLTAGAGADCVIPVVGVSAAYRQGYEMLKHYDGRFVVFAAGYPKPELAIDFNEIHARRTEIIGTLDGNIVEFMQVASMMEHGIIDCSVMLEGATFPLREIQQAYELASQPQTYRVTIDPQGI